MLVGLMGAGKTVVGRRCAELLGRPFVDTDELVEATVHMRVAEIFDTAGEEAFRDLERRAVEDACASPTPLVIACGGGAVLDAGNRCLLRDSGFVVWLRAAPEVLGARVGEGEDRPLLRRGDGVAVTLQALAVQRAPHYEDVAHRSVDTEGRDVEQVAERVVEELASWNG